YGMVIACNDDPALRALLPRVSRRVLTYGEREGSDFLILKRASENIGPTWPISTFNVSYKGTDLGGFRLHVPGAHNVLNATAALAVGVGLDVDPAHIRIALENFRGVDRRFQLKATVGGVGIIDDYGHHPTEIRATLAAARQCG